MNIYTNTNSDLSCTWNDKTFTLLGFESISFTDSRTNTITYNSNRSADNDDDDGIVNKEGGANADSMVLSINLIRDSDLKVLKSWANSFNQGDIMLTHKQNEDLKVVFRGMPVNDTFQNSVDNTASGKIEISFTGRLKRNDY